MRATNSSPGRSGAPRVSGGSSFDTTGVDETAEEHLARLEPDAELGREMERSNEVRLRELGICRLIVMDVRGEAESEERDGRRRR